MNDQLFRLRFASLPVSYDPVGAQKVKLKAKSYSPKMLSFFRTVKGPKETLASHSTHASGNPTAEAKFHSFVGVGQMYSNVIGVNDAFTSTFATKRPAIGTF